MRDIRPTILATADPKLSANDVVKLMAVKWETVDEKLKKKYQEEYKQEQVNFNCNCVRWSTCIFFNILFYR